MTDNGIQAGFFAELKRRNVFRVAIAYVVVAWILLQISDVLFPALALPEWGIRLVAALLILGFPLAIFFAWAFELTPEGLKREHEVVRDQSITHETGRKLDFIVIGVLVIALALFVVDKFVWQPKNDADTAAVGVIAESEKKSIAVLPFANMSDDPANEYFSDGISEELLNLLAKVPELRVIGRTSSFQFKNKNEDLRVIGEKLGVAHILEGSVRKSGNTVRVTAQLISTSNGSHLWSDTFDRDLDDVFAVQDEIARSVVNALKVKLLGQAMPERQPPRVTEAYDLYLRGKYFYERLGTGDVAKAQDYYDRALELDPQLALAWDGRGAVYVRQMLNGVLSFDQGRAVAKEAVERALELDPMLADAHYHVGFQRMFLDWDWSGAEAGFTRTLAIEPNHAGAMSGAGLLAIALGRTEAAIDYQKRSILIDPLRSASQHNLGFIYYQSGQYRLAEAAFRNALEMSGGTYTRGNHYLSLILLAQGELDAALAESQREIGDQWRLVSTIVISHALGLHAESDAALDELIAKFADTAAYIIADAHAYRGEIDETFEWLERAYVQRDALLTWVSLDPLLKNVKSDAQFDALLEKLNLAN